jgi:NAD dependent epimerase/dehydratase
MELKTKRVLVTGADGFIGSHLVEALQGKCTHVRALAQYNSFNSWGWLEELPNRNNVEVVTGDVRDSHFCYELTRDVDVIFHLAALIAIPYSYKSPENYVDTNIKGTLNLCQAAKANGIQKFIQTSTSEVYGTAQYVPIDERHPLNPQSPYSATKIGADAIALSFYYSFDLPVVVARPFNTYGPRQSARAVIPTIISQLAAGNKTVRLGDVRTTRDFTFVEDTCRGFVAIAGMEGGSGEVFHIGSNSEIAIGDLFRLIAGTMSVDAEIVQEAQRLRPAASEVQRLWCDNSKLRRLCGFVPTCSMEQGIAATVGWFRDPKNLSRYKESLYNV